MLYHESCLPKGYMGRLAGQLSQATWVIALLSVLLCHQNSHVALHHQGQTKVKALQTPLCAPRPGILILISSVDGHILCKSRIVQLQTIQSVSCDYFSGIASAQNCGPENLSTYIRGPSSPCRSCHSACGTQSLSHQAPLPACCSHDCASWSVGLLLWG